MAGDQKRFGYLGVWGAALAAETASVVAFRESSQATEQLVDMVEAAAAAPAPPPVTMLPMPIQKATARPAPRPASAPCGAGEEEKNGQRKRKTENCCRGAAGQAGRTSE